MGMADEIKRKAMPQKSGGEVATRVAEGQADIGLTLIAEIVPIPGVRVIGKIPAAARQRYDLRGRSIRRMRRSGRAPPPSSPRWRNLPNAEVWTAAGFEWPG